VTAAKQSDIEKVLVFAHDEGVESRDRTSLALPFDQDRIISVLSGTGKTVIVVLSTGGPVTMPWIDDVDAVLQTWYPGQEGGTATADLIFGVENPGGKLPVTFPSSESQLSFHGDPIAFPGLENRVVYSEGLKVGN